MKSDDTTSAGGASASSKFGKKGDRFKVIGSFPVLGTNPGDTGTLDHDLTESELLLVGSHIEQAKGS